MFRLAVTFFVLTSIFGCAGRETRDPKRGHLHLTIGTDHLNNARYPQALSELTMAEKFDPENPIIQNNLGIAYYVRKKYSEAEKHLRQAVDLDPNYTEARNNLGRTLTEMNLIDDAIDVLKISDLDLKYTNPEQTKSNLGIAYFKKNDFPKAKHYLGEALRLSGQNCITSSYYGRALFELNNFEQAALAFDQSINNCRTLSYDEPMYYAGLTYFKLGKTNEAIARFEDVISSYPNGMYVDQSREMLQLIKK
jgi:type IV pilus assembly protein PilF